MISHSDQNTKQNQNQPTSNEFFTQIISNTKFFNKGLWSIKEKLKYNLFVYHNRDKFLTKKQRKSRMIFRQMSRFIKTRNMTQCRTYHKKILRKEKGLENFVIVELQKNPRFLSLYQSVKPKIIQFDNQELIKDNSRIVSKQLTECKNKQIFSYQNSKINKQNSANFTPVSERERISEMLKIIQIRKMKLQQCAYYFSLWISKFKELIKDQN